MYSFEKIFEAFPHISKEEWKEKVTADLKGKAFDVLVWEDEDGIVHQPYYNAQDLPSDFPLIAEQQAWKIVQSYDLGEWNKEELKKELDVAFKNGLEIAILKTDELSEDLVSELAHHEDLYWQSDSEKSTPNRLSDPISKEIGKKDPQLDPAQLKSRLGNGKILVNGLLYAEKGASAVQEMVCILRHTTEYFDLLTEAGMSVNEISDRLIIKCSIGSSYFTQLSKIRALRINLRKLLAHYGVDQEPLIWAESNDYYLDSESFNNNLIRLSCQAMAAVLGNSDWVSLSLQAALKDQKSFAARMSRNVQLILKHESHLDEVDDLVRGAYYIEHLSSELESLSWEGFVEAEESGSFLGQLGSTDFWARIEATDRSRKEAYQKGEKVMVGVNKYPFEEEKKGERVKGIDQALSEQIKKEA